MVVPNGVTGDSDRCFLTGAPSFALSSCALRLTNDSWSDNRWAFAGSCSTIRLVCMVGSETQLGSGARSEGCACGAKGGELASEGHCPLPGLSDATGWFGALESDQLLHQPQNI